MEGWVKSDVVAEKLENICFKALSRSWYFYTKKKWKKTQHQHNVNIKRML